MTPATTASRGRSETRALVLAAVILVFGVGARLAVVHRPFDHRLLNPWRQADYFQIARNLDRDGLNILYPRVDWRGDTPGYAEMELPILPWAGAALYGVFGEHVQVLRALSALSECASLLLFAAFAWRLLVPAGAVLAIAAFAWNPLLNTLAGSLQPEPVTHLFSLGAMVLLWNWHQRGHFGYLVAACAAIGVAMLAKLPSASLGLVFAYCVLERLGLRGLRDGRVLGAAAVAILPPLAWYTWAHQFWTRYGMSLGLSNETHLIGLDMLWPPRFLVGIATWETLGVVSPLGWLLMLVAVTSGWSDRVRFAAAWCGAVWLFYLAAARTTADSWAYYYHSLSVPPACLLMGAGFAALWEGRVARWPGSWMARHRRGLAVAVAATVLLFEAVATGYLLRRRDGRTDLLVKRDCGFEFLSHVPPGGQIVVLGGSMYDEYGTPVAHNESMMFAWMDRTGFCYGEEERSVPTLEAIARRGGRFWIAARREVEAPGMRDQVDRRFQRLAGCKDEYYLYDLQRSRT